ncbi:MAG: molybdate ABC transporter permease subunit [Thermodesulfatator sp.]|nr:MAG: molybdate ABC transporter permease subunit [Thermodesulfatator sp.]
MDLFPLYLSAKLALITTVLLLILAAPVAYFLVYVRFPGKPLIEALIGLPLVMPPTVLGFYLLVILGPKGILGRLWQEITGQPLIFTFPGIVLASLIYSFPFAVQPLKTAFEKIDRRLLEVAYVLGCSPFMTFFKVIVPNALNGVAASAILAFAHTMGEFGVVLMVGGSIPGKTRVASIAIYEYVESLRYREAGLLSLALVMISYLVLLTVNFLNRRGNHGS